MNRGAEPRWQVGQRVTYAHHSGAYTWPAMVLRNRREHPLSYEYELILDNGEVMPAMDHEISEPVL